jgi:hypothetical protein
MSTVTSSSGLPRRPFSYRPSLRDTVIAACFAIAAGAFAGGVASIPAALLGAVTALYLQYRRAVEREQSAVARLVAAAPPLVDLFAAALASGLLPADAALTVAEAFDPDRPLMSVLAATSPPSIVRPPSAPSSASFGATSPEPATTLTAHVVLARRFHIAGCGLRVGIDPEFAWRALLVDEATAAVGAAALRASQTGAPAAAAVAKAAEAGRAAARHAAQSRVRACAVRATAPLALCFLPGFILLGILPTAVSLLDSIQS